MTMVFYGDVQLVLYMTRVVSFEAPSGHAKSQARESTGSGTPTAHQVEEFLRFCWLAQPSTLCLAWASTWTSSIDAAWCCSFSPLSCTKSRRSLPLQCRSRGRVWRLPSCSRESWSHSACGFASDPVTIRLKGAREPHSLDPTMSTGQKLTQLPLFLGQRSARVRDYSGHLFTCVQL